MNTATVNISIKDVNNKPPVLNDLPTLRIVENTPVGSAVIKLQATDPDQNPILRYKLNPEHSEARNEEGVLVKASEYDYQGAFELDAIQGELQVVKILDREKVEHIKLAITVEDLAAAKGKQLVEGKDRSKMEEYKLFLTFQLCSLPDHTDPRRERQQSALPSTLLPTEHHREQHQWRYDRQRAGLRCRQESHHQLRAGREPSLPAAGASRCPNRFDCRGQ